MTNTDMIAWFAIDGVGETRDYYSTSHNVPQEDSVSNLVDGVEPVFDSSTGLLTFITRRKLDTGDSDEDYVVEPGIEMAMIYGYKKGDTKWKKHDEYGVWSLLI